MFKKIASNLRGDIELFVKFISFLAIFFTIAGSIFVFYILMLFTNLFFKF